MIRFADTQRAVFAGAALLVLFTAMHGCGVPYSDAGDMRPDWPGRHGPEPQRYACRRAAAAPVIDGRLDDACWQAAEWTREFADILGGDAPSPRFATRAKMSWDDEHFYIAAQLEEPHVWAKLTARDSVIFYDNDFEVFIDPDGDTHAYYELELNAFSTEWDLFLVKPYRDGGPAIHGWDIAGLRSAVHVDGTINDPSDEDRGWSVEMAIPWAALKEAAGREAPPVVGDLWRANFSRVEWQTRVVDGDYQKVVDPRTGKPYPEDNWVWSPQGVVNMHCPETWGLVLFVDTAPASAQWPVGLQEELAARHVLRQLYHAQTTYREKNGDYVDDLSALRRGLPGTFHADDCGRYQWPPRVVCTESFFEAVLSHEDGRSMHIAHDGRIWITGPGDDEDGEK